VRDRTSSDRVDLILSLKDTAFTLALRGMLQSTVRLVESKLAALSTRLKVRVVLDQVEGFGERHALKQAEPFTRVPVVRQIEAIPADILQTCKGCLEFRLVRPRVVGPEPRDKPVFVAVPLPVSAIG